MLRFKDGAAGLEVDEAGCGGDLHGAAPEVELVGRREDWDHGDPVIGWRGFEGVGDGGAACYCDGRGWRRVGFEALLVEGVGVGGRVEFGWKAMLDGPCHGGHVV